MAKTYLERLLGENERIILVTRQHWLLMVGAIIAEVIATIVIIVAVTIALPISPLIGLAYLVLILPVGHGFYDFLRWWNVEYVVTNRRVIHLSGVLNKDVTDSSLEKVNDVKMEQSFLGRRIGDPIRFKTAMLNAKENVGQDEDAPRPSPHSLHQTIPELIAELDQLRQRGILSDEEFDTKKRELLAKI
jgi:hypothetical protein